MVLSVIAMLPSPIDASHGWSNYHWRRTSAAIKLIPVRRYHSTPWVARYNTAMTDWRKAAMTKIKPYTALATGARNPCPLANGQVSSCDGSYGNTGWLGLASIAISGGHIALGRSLVNNTYFNTPAYNTVAWRQAVICQEIGHTFGLGHVNVVFNNRNTGSCMDYTNDPDGGPGGAVNDDPNNMHPNAHDYALINTRHTHIGSILPGFSPEQELVDMPRALQAYNPTVLAQFGKLVWSGNGGRTERYEVEFANGWKVANWVIWANSHDGR
jgi:hypothetical protein